MHTDVGVIHLRMVAKSRLFRLSAVAIAGAISSQAIARGSMHSEERWAQAHISRLPAELQQAVLREAHACGNVLAAEHDFARYITAGARLIAIHYEHTNCANRGAVCSATGCLHQVFVSTGSNYRLVLSVHSSEVQLTRVGEDPAVTVGCTSSARCTRTLIWNGSRFVGQ